MEMSSPIRMSMIDLRRIHDEGGEWGSGDDVTSHVTAVTSLSQALDAEALEAEGRRSWGMDQLSRDGRPLDSFAGGSGVYAATIERTEGGGRGGTLSVCKWGGGGIAPFK